MATEEELQCQNPNGPQNKNKTSEIKSLCSKACDSAYGSNNSHSFKSGSSKSQQSRSSGTGSNASTEQTSISHSIAGTTELGPKSRKEKGAVRKRKGRAVKTPPSNLIQPSNAPHDSNAAQPMVASTAVPNCSPTVNTTGLKVERATTSSVASKPSRPSSTTLENRALQVAALTRALDYLQNVTQTQPSSPLDGNPLGARSEHSSVSCHSVLKEPLLKEVFPNFTYLEDDPSAKGNDSFVAAVSLQDGVVTFVTSGLYEALGFPPEMWMGRSMLDFLHPKDRLVFTNQLTAGLMANSARRLDQQRSVLKDCNDKTAKDTLTNTLCCRLRMYRGLRSSGFAVKEKKLSYLPFRVVLSLQKVQVTVEEQLSKHNLESEASEEDSTYYLLAQATRLVSAYNGAKQKNLAGNFALRHTGNCLFSEVDMGCVPYLGHLPQDLLGTSVFDLYHPNDLPVLKEIYATVLAKQGKLIRSQPYHIRAHNGCYVLLETDWSCFVNPWSKKVEFVVGQHRVLEGPSNPDVFALPDSEPGTPVSQQQSEVILALQNEIKNTLYGCTVDNPPQEVEIMGVATRRRKDLAIFMGSLIDEVAKSGGSQSPITFPGGASVVFGDISPHRGNSSPGSNSSEAPLSYTHLNYKENIDRFFASQPKTMPSRSSNDSQPERRITPNTSSEEEGRRGGESGTSQGDSSLKSSHKQNSSNSMEHRTNSSSSEDKYPGPALTTILLSRHNQDMEKEFMQHHRELRNKCSLADRAQRIPRLPDVHGLKRTGAASWENGNVQKHPHRDSFVTPTSPISPNPRHGALSTVPVGIPVAVPLLPVNLWPPFCMSGTDPISSQTLIPTAPVGLGVARSGLGSPLTTVTVTNSVPGLTTYYMTPAPTQQPRLSEPVNAVPFAAPFFIPQAGLQPFNAGAIPYSTVPCIGMPGVMYQPMGYGQIGAPMMMPMMLQPHVMMGMNTLSSVLLASTPAQNASALHSRSSSPEPGIRERLDGRRMCTPSTSKQPEDGANLSTTRPASEATSVKVEPGSVGASNISGHIRVEMGSRFTTLDRSTSQGPESWERSNHWPESSESYLDSTSTSQGNDQTRDTSNGSIYTESHGSNNFSNLEANNYSSMMMPWETEKEAAPKRRNKTPPWMEDVNPTPEFTFQYQVPGKELQDVLEADRQALSRLQQPALLNDQLLALYREMESDQSEADLHLEENMAASSDGSTSEGNRRSLSRRRREEFRKTMIYEADGPIPKP